jgi:uncharacterized protein (TIGR03000 family)
MLIYTHAVWGMDLHAFFGPDGWMGETATRSLQSGQFIFSYLWYLPPDWLSLAHRAALIVLVMFTVGLFTRVTSVLSFIILINYAHRAPAALFGLDQINAMLTMYLAVGPSGAAFSIDRLFVRYRQAQQLMKAEPIVRFFDPPLSVAANVALRLIQVHMCVIYLFAGVSKLLGEAWWDGTAIWRAAASYEYQSVDLIWLAHVPLVVNLLTHLAAYFEVSYCVLIWPRVSRPIVLFVAALLHMAIGICMGMMTFGLIMLVGNLSFTSPVFARGVVAMFARGRRRMTVAYDGTCKLCVRWMSFIKALDFGDQIKLVDFNRAEPPSIHPLLTREACLAAIQVVRFDESNRALFAGYWGFKVIAGQLRSMWPIVPLFYLPGAGAIGPIVYKAIARDQARRLGCYSGACASHSGAIEGLASPARSPVTLTIRLPEDAKLFVQGELYPGSGPKRTFVTTPARYGKDYLFNIRVEFMHDGAPLSMSQDIRVRAGQRCEVGFWIDQPSQGGGDGPNDSETGNPQPRATATSTEEQDWQPNRDSVDPDQSTPTNGNGKHDATPDVQPASEQSCPVQSLEECRIER